MVRPAESNRPTRASPHVGKTAPSAAAEIHRRWLTSTQAGHPRCVTNPSRGGGMVRLAWPRRPLPDGRGEVWRWRLSGLGELAGARAALRARLHDAGRPAEADDPSSEQLVLAFDELASNALRHGERPVIATVVAGSGGWLPDVSDRASRLMPAPTAEDR